MFTWAEKLEQAKETDEYVRLHCNRFGVWMNFIHIYSKKQGLTSEIIPRNDEGASEFEKAVIATGNSFSKVLLYKEGVPFVTFDASFGSMDVTSDLDITVISTHISIMDEWIEYLTIIRNGSLTFTEEYDSNFYYEPGVLVDESGQITLVSKVEANLADILPHTADVEYLITLIESYAVAYINKSCLTIGKHHTYPNPNSPAFTQEAEIAQFCAMKEYGQKLNDDCTSLNFCTYACTKTESLLCVGSLAICGVYGPQIQDIYVNNSQKKTSWRLVAAFEMLYNLKMHHNSDGFKTKYIVRLKNVLHKSENTCKNEKSQSWVDNQISTTKGIKTVPFEQIATCINYIIEDEIDGKDCPNLPTISTKSLQDNKSLDDIIVMFKNYIVRLVSEKSAKQTATFQTFVRYN